MNQKPPLSLSLGGWNANELIGTQLGSCILERPLGVGGMGAVFLARQTRPKRQVAVKLIRPLGSADPRSWKIFMARFRREADATAALDHANIVPIFEFGEEGTMAYLVMPYLADGSLAAILTREGRLPMRRALSYLDQTAAALDCAHKNGIIHRDVKPSNLLKHPDGRLMLADFGIARLLQVRDTPLPVDTDAGADGSLTQAGMAMGTPEYMAPELVRGEPVTPLVDIYSLATVGYAMLAGRTPFGGGDVTSILARQVRETPPPIRAFAPETPPEIERVIMQALAKSPADRPQSARAFASALRTAAASLDGQGAGTGAYAIPSRDGAAPQHPRTLGSATVGRQRALRHTEALAPVTPSAPFGQSNPGADFAQSSPGLDATIYDPAIATGPRRAAGDGGFAGGAGNMGNMGNLGGGVPVWPGAGAGRPADQPRGKRKGTLPIMMLASAGAIVLLLMVLLVGSAMGSLLSPSGNTPGTALSPSKQATTSTLPTVTPSPTATNTPVPTDTPVAPANWLSATPASIELTCNGSAEITLTNQGNEHVSWSAQKPGFAGISLSQSSGRIPANGSVTIKVTNTSSFIPRSGTITFTPGSDQAGDPATVDYTTDGC